MRKLGVAIGLGFLLALLVGLIFQTWRIGGLKDRIEEDQAVMDSLNNRVVVADSFAAAIDSVAEKRLGELGLEVEQLEGQLVFEQEAAEDAEEKLEGVLEALPDSVQEIVEEAVTAVQAAHEGEMRSLVELLAVERESAMILSGQLAAQRDLNRELQAALSEANVQINFYQNEVTNPFSFSIKADFVKVSLALVGGMILQKVID